MAKYNQFNAILQALKRCFSVSQPAREARNLAVHPTKTGPRGGKQYLCANCGECFGQKGVQLDHDDPVIPLEERARDMTWGRIIARLFCDLDNLQVLCKECHKAKTACERKQRMKK